MNSTDKKVAIGGVTLIIILAIVAIVLLKKQSNSPVKIIDSVETVDVEGNITNNEMAESANQNNIVAKPVKSTTKAVEVTTDSEFNEYYVRKNLKAVRNDDSQMAELYTYWDEYKLDAVADLIRLERVRNLTIDLKYSDDYYYYGEVNSDNIPNGKGLAIYADDTYYFGEWKNGLREGQGYYLRIYPDKEGKEGIYTGVLEHQYCGEFKNDLPNGEGQEHYSYNVTNLSDPEHTIVNVIGTYKNGYYDGEEYIMTIDNNGRTYDWYATAKDGTYAVCVENKVSTTGKKPYWQKGDDNNHETDEQDDGFMWFPEDEVNKKGIAGLKK